MQILMLGGLQVTAGGAPLALPRGQLRAVLGLLALRRNSVVTAERIVDMVWGEGAHDRVRKSLQTQIWRLRRLFGGEAAQRLEGWGSGYLLRLEEGATDLDRFRAHASRGERLLSEGRAREARACLGSAMELWRGDPLDGVVFDGVRPNELAGLAEIRLSTCESWIEAGIVRGHAATVIPEIRALLVEHPLRERLYGQLMTALYLCDRRVEALETFGAARRLLRTEFGMEPGPALQEIQQRVLAGTSLPGAPTRDPR